MVQLTQNMQKISKKWKKRQKCIDITLRKWSWRPLWQVGKKSINRFHSPAGELFEGFGIFPHLSTCLGGVEKSQNPKSFSKIWLWKRLNEGVIFSEFRYFFFKKSGKIQKNSKNSKKIKNEPGVMYCLIYIFFRFYFWRFGFQKNIFPIIGKFWKGPWDSGTHRVWVYREKINIGFFAQTFGGSSYTCREARKKFWVKKSMLNFSR